MKESSRVTPGRTSTRNWEAVGLSSALVNTPCCLSASLCSFWECTSTCPTGKVEPTGSIPKSCAIVPATYTLNRLSYDLIPKSSDRNGTGLLWSHFYLCVQSKVAWGALMELLCAHHYESALSYQGTGNGRELGRHPQNWWLLWDRCGPGASLSPATKWRGSIHSCLEGGQRQETRVVFCLCIQHCMKLNGLSLCILKTTLRDGHFNFPYL